MLKMWNGTDGRSGCAASFASRNRGSRQSLIRHSHTSSRSFHRRLDRVAPSAVHTLAQRISSTARAVRNVLGVLDRSRFARAPAATSCARHHANDYCTRRVVRPGAASTAAGTRSICCCSATRNDRSIGLARKDKVPEAVSSLREAGGRRARTRASFAHEEVPAVGVGERGL